MLLNSARVDVHEVIFLRNRVFSVCPSSPLLIAKHLKEAEIVLAKAKQIYSARRRTSDFYYCVESLLQVQSNLRSLTPGHLDSEAQSDIASTLSHTRRYLSALQGIEARHYTVLWSNMLKLLDSQASSSAEASTDCRPPDENGCPFQPEVHSRDQGMTDESEVDFNPGYPDLLRHSSIESDSHFTTSCTLGCDSRQSKRSSKWAYHENSSESASNGEADRHSETRDSRKTHGNLSTSRSNEKHKTFYYKARNERYCKSKTSRECNVRSPTPGFEHRKSKISRERNVRTRIPAATSQLYSSRREITNRTRPLVRPRSLESARERSTRVQTPPTSRFYLSNYEITNRIRPLVRPFDLEPVDTVPEELLRISQTDQITCIFCQRYHYSHLCTKINTLEKRRAFFYQQKLCFSPRRCRCRKTCYNKCHFEQFCKWPHCTAVGSHYSALCEKAPYPIMKQEVDDYFDFISKRRLEICLDH